MDGFHPTLNRSVPLTVKDGGALCSQSHFTGEGLRDSRASLGASRHDVSPHHRKERTHEDPS
jgi:hypothetical protein